MYALKWRYGKFGWRGRPWPREREGPATKSWEALAAYMADTLRDNVIEYVKTIAEVRAKVEYER